jgi:chemotaxis protein histidine kinase CheA
LAITPEAYPFQVNTDVFRVDANHNRQILVPVKLLKRNGFDENVTLTFVGAPQNAQVENKPINKGAAEGIYRIFLPNNVPVGTYTVYMKATAAVKYRRRLELADKAKAALNESVAAATQATEALTKANAEKDAATKKAVETDAAFKKATTDKEAATKKVAETAEAVKKATEAKDKATTDADKDATAKALTAAQEEAKKATDALAVADKALADSDAANKAAIAAKTKSEADAKAADDKNKAAAADKAVKEKALNDTNTATKENSVNVFTPSTPIVITVKPNAVNVTTAPANGGALKRGDKVEVKVTLQRVNGFAGPLTLELVPPPGIVGLAAEKVTIPADKAEGAIIVTATADATEGAIANAVVRASADFDGSVAASDGAVAINVSK